MKSKIAALLLAAGILFASAAPALAYTPETAIDAAEASTVIIFGTMQSEVTDPVAVALLGKSVTVVHNYAFCSGVLAAASETIDVIVTARHCMSVTPEDGQTISTTPETIKFNDGTRYKVQKYLRSPSDDIGLIYIEHTGHPVINISTTGIQRGVDYFAFSMPSGFAWSYTPAYAMQGDKYDVAYKHTAWQYTNLFTCPGCGPGDSGGGIYDSTGSLVGISVAGDEKYCLSVPSARVLAILDNLASAEQSKTNSTAVQF